MIVVTGASGVLGSHLLLRLTQDGQGVRALYRSEGNKARVQRLFELQLGERASACFANIEWIPCDILDVIALTEALEGATQIYHCAAMVSFQSGNFATMMRINRYGTANVVNCALELPDVRLVHVSSTAAVARDPNQPEACLLESNKWVQGPETSRYSITKYSAEKEVWRGMEEGLNAVILNPSIILGAGDWSQSSLSILRTLKRGLSFYPLGKNAFVDARDVADALVLLMQSGIRNERFLCTGHALSYKSLFEGLSRAMGIRAPRYAVQPWMSELLWRVLFIPRLFGASFSITKETARSAQRTTCYSSEKLCSTFDFQFRSVEELFTYAAKGEVK